MKISYSTFPFEGEMVRSKRYDFDNAKDAYAMAEKIKKKGFPGNVFVVTAKKGIPHKPWFYVTEPVPTKAQNERLLKIYEKNSLMVRWNL